MQKIIIVGASSGIGRAFAARLNKSEYKAYNISRTKCDVEGVHNREADVTDGVGFGAVLKEILAAEGHIDAGVYCAGHGIAVPVELADIERCRYLFDVNYFGAVRFCRELIPAMRGANSGRLILVGSMAGQIPVPFESFYCGSKAALGALAQGLALELQPYDIRVTCVMPGGTKTAFTARREKADCTRTVYNQRYNNALANIGVIEARGMDADKVAIALSRLLNRKNTPIFYPVGLSNHLNRGAAKLLPASAVNRMAAAKFDT